MFWQMKCLRWMTMGWVVCLAVRVLGAYGDSRLANFSCLATVRSDDPNPLTLGFVSVTTDVPPLGEPLLLRAVGPTLAQFGISDGLQSPEMTLWKSGQMLYPITGHDQAAAGAAITVGAFPLTAGSADAAVLISLAPGDYTLVISGPANAGATVLGEIYDQAFTFASNYLANLSALSYIHASSANTVGFVLAGSVSRSVLIRAIGPSLANFGVAQAMPDPMIVLHAAADGTEGDIASNAGWLGSPSVEAAASTAGAFSLAPGSKDAAMVVTLPPGAYTFTVSSMSGAAGTTLAEVYLLPE
jgi:hypothetical protein